MNRRFVLIAAVVSIVAQTASAEPLTLNEAVQQALVFDPAIQRANAVLDRSQASADSARAKRGVTVGLQTQIGILETDFTTNRVTQTPRQIGLQAEWPVYRSGALTASVDAARLQVRASEKTMDGAREATVLSTVEAYAQLWLASRVMDVSDARVETFKLRLRETRALVEQGVATRTDTALTEARLASAEASHASSIAASSSARARLMALTGSANPEPVSPFQSTLAIPESADLALQRVYSNNPDLAAAKSMQSAADHRLREARARFGPRVSLKARASAGEDVFFFFEEPVTDVGAFVTLEIPLFTNGQRSASERGARAGRNEAAASVRSAELQLRESVMGLWANLKARQTALSAADRGEKAAALAAEGAQKEYQAGIRTLVDALDAENDYREAQIARYRQQTLLLIAQARLLSLSADLELALSQ